MTGSLSNHSFPRIVSFVIFPIFPSFLKGWLKFWINSCNELEKLSFLKKKKKFSFINIIIWAPFEWDMFFLMMLIHNLHARVKPNERSNEHLFLKFLGKNKLLHYIRWSIRMGTREIIFFRNYEYRNNSSFSLERIM